MKMRRYYWLILPNVSLTTRSALRKALLIIDRHRSRRGSSTHRLSDAMPNSISTTSTSRITVQNIGEIRRQWGVDPNETMLLIRRSSNTVSSATEDREQPVTGTSMTLCRPCRRLPMGKKRRRNNSHTRRHRSCLSFEIRPDTVSMDVYQRRV